MPVDSRAFVGLGKEPLQSCAINVQRVFVNCLLLISCVFAAVNVSGQIQASTSASAPGSYVCVRHGPHSRVWQYAVLHTNQSGYITTNLHSYTELATGICYLSGGQYVDSVEEIDPVANGAQATQGRYQVQWAANANTPGGAVTLTTADNKQLLSTVFGLAWCDTASGATVMLGQLQDCTATIGPASNVLVYGNAFSNITADLQYTYRKAGLSQDIVLRQQPLSPTAYGLNPATTRLQVITEFFNPPAPVVTTVTNGSIPDDRILNFGDMQMGPGRAFLFQTNATPGPSGYPVAKRWTNIDNRTFLIEEIPYPMISNSLSSLHSSVIKPDKGRVRRTVFLDHPGPKKASAMMSKQPVKTAKTAMLETAFVLDYDLDSSTNNLTLQGDTTYIVSGGEYVEGNLTIEGGTVVKYTNGGAIYLTNLACETASYRPGVFTDVNDNSVGEEISGSSGSPTQNDETYLYFEGLYTNSLNLHNLRLSYASFAVRPDGIVPIGATYEIEDCQFVDCNAAFFNEGEGDEYFIPCSIIIYNVLFTGCEFGFESLGSSPPGFLVSFVNITADQMGALAYCATQTNNFSGAVNSIFTGVTDLSNVSLTNCYTNSAIYPRINNSTC
jgi:hypothetical protein